MDLSDITRLISSLRAQTARDSITPNGLGSILQRIVDAISSMSGIDVEDEEAILQRLSEAEANASTALQTAQNAQAGAAGNVIDSFTQSQDEDEVSLSIKQHGHSAKQVVLPAASSTGAGIMTATDKSHLDTAYGKRINLMSAPSSESVVTLTITFGDGTTKSVTFVGATAGTGGKAGLMTKEQADQLAALVAAGTAENVRDDAGYLKQQYAAPVILRNVSDETVDDLSVGDIFYDAGKLWQCGTTENTDMGAPSKKVIYYCLADQTLYRWTGSRFVQAVSISSGDVTVPTKLSDLINDMGFLTAHQPLKTINGQTITGTGNITIDGAAELKDASSHIKQSVATPVVLRNVTEASLDDLNIGDVFYDTGELWCVGNNENYRIGTPSKQLIYYCLADQKFYRWNGSSFSIIQTAGTDGVTPHIDQTTGNWFIGTTNTGVHAQGEKGEKGDTGATGPQGPAGPAGAQGNSGVASADGVESVNNLNGGTTDTSSRVYVLGANQGKRLRDQIDYVYQRLQSLYSALGNIAFWDGKPAASTLLPDLDWGNPKHAVTLALTLTNAVVKHNGAAKSNGDTILVEEGSTLTLIVEPASSGYELTTVTSSTAGATVTDLGNGTYSVAIVMGGSNVTLNVAASAEDHYLSPENGELVFWLDGLDVKATDTSWADKISLGNSDEITLVPNGTIGQSTVMPDEENHCWKFADANIKTNGVFLTSNATRNYSPSLYTIEVVYKTTSFGGSAINRSKIISFARSAADDINPVIYYSARNAGSSGWIDGARIPSSSIENDCWALNNELNTPMVVGMNGDTAVSKGLILQTIGATHWSADSNITALGGTLDPNNGTTKTCMFAGNIYAVRVWSGKLTAAQMLHNQRVDNERYNLGLTLPESVQ